MGRRDGDGGKNRTRRIGVAVVTDRESAAQTFQYERRLRRGECKAQDPTDAAYREQAYPDNDDDDHDDDARGAGAVRVHFHPRKILVESSCLF